MYSKTRQTDKKILHNHNGWSLLELVTVMATIGILAALSINYAIDFLRTTRDTAAMSDAQNVMTIIYGNFLNRHSVDFTATDKISATTTIGIKTADGTSRPPIFKLSSDVKIYFDPSDANTSYPDGTPGSFHAWFYHPFGSADRLGLCAGVPTEGRRCFEVYVDEGDSISEILIW